MKSNFYVCFILLSSLLRGADFPHSTKDSIYIPSIKTVQLYLDRGNSNDVINPAVAVINAQAFRLEFDVLENEARSLIAKIYHCNSDWSISPLFDVDYLEDFNEFNIVNFSPSFNTKVNYVHYNFLLPPVLRSGNFVIAVFDEETERLLVVRRFSVCAPLIEILGSIPHGSNSVNNNRQRIEFKFPIRNLPIRTPSQDIKVVVRQNGRPDREIHGIQPTFESPTLLTYRLFKDSEQFPGGNEYRTLDMRSIQFNGMGMGFTNRNANPTAVRLTPTKKRGAQSYLQTNDINGAYVIDHYESGNGQIESDYIQTLFLLESGYELQDHIYLFGSFTNWKVSEQFKMVYSPEEKMYKGFAFLKQGYYNYEYVSIRDKKVSCSLVEGDHYQTENFYEILVYMKPIGDWSDQLIGYTVLTTHR